MRATAHRAGGELHDLSARQSSTLLIDVGDLEDAGRPCTECRRGRRRAGARKRRTSTMLVGARLRLAHGPRASPEAVEGAPRHALIARGGAAQTASSGTAR